MLKAGKITQLVLLHNHNHSKEERKAKVTTIESIKKGHNVNENNSPRAQCSTIEIQGPN